MLPPLVSVEPFCPWAFILSSLPCAGRAALVLRGTCPARSWACSPFVAPGLSWPRSCSSRPSDFMSLPPFMSSVPAGLAPGGLAGLARLHAGRRRRRLALLGGAGALRTAAPEARSAERWNPATLAAHAVPCAFAKPVPATSAAAATEIIKRLDIEYLLTCSFALPAPTTKGGRDVPEHRRFRGICLCERADEPRARQSSAQTKKAGCFSRPLAASRRNASVVACQQVALPQRAMPIFSFRRRRRRRRSRSACRSRSSACRSCPSLRRA